MYLEQIRGYWTVPNLLKNRRKLNVQSNRSCLKMTCDRATWVWCLFKFIWYNQNPFLLFQCIAICCAPFESSTTMPLQFCYFFLWPPATHSFSADGTFFFLQRIKWWLELVPSCWQRRPAQQHWQEVQGWRSFHTWRWSNTEPRVGFWCKEVMLAEEMHFSIKLEIVVLLPPFFCLVCNQNVYDPLIPIKTGERKTSRAF